MMKNMSALLALAAGTLGLGMSEFGMMSVLSGAATDLNVSIPQAGHFVAAYALGVCAGALLLIFIARGRPLKKTLLVLAALMTAGNLLAALSPDYAAMLAMRFVSGLPHGAFFGVGGIIAEKVAPPGAPDGGGQHHDRRHDGCQFVRHSARHRNCPCVFLAGDVCFGGGMGFVHLLHGMADGAGGAAAARSRVEKPVCFSRPSGALVSAGSDHARQRRRLLLVQLY